jgi:methionyl-tRNA synthetase
MPALIAEMLSTPQEAPVSETPPPTTPPEVAAAPERAPDKPQITYDDFAKVDLRAGTVVAAAKHPKADRLLVLTVDVGEASPRTIVAGIASKYAPEDLVGRQVVVVVNLAPAKLRGVESQGMLLAAGGQDVLALVTVDCAPGQSIK